MENNIINDTVGSLSEVIEKMQNSINTLAKNTTEMGNQIQIQSTKFKENSTLADKSRENMNKYLELHTQHFEELKTRFDSTYLKQDNLLEEINNWFDKWQLIISDQITILKKTGLEFNDAIAQTVDIVQSYQKENMANLKLWEEHANSLLSKIDNNLSSFDKSVTIKMDTASKTVSNTLEPTLFSLTKSLIETKEILNKNRRQMLITNIIVTVLVIAASILIIVLKTPI